MRQELRDFDWHVYGLSISDLDYTIEIVKKIIAEKRQLVEQAWEREKEENPDVADDIMDDIAYYSWIEGQYLWSFCLWRLQGIFEGIITTRFLSNQPEKFGLHEKLRSMQEAGFELDDATKNELLDWGRLRNALSHMPPEQHRPAMITESDISEYHVLLLRVLTVWLQQMEPKSENE